MDNGLGKEDKTPHDDAVYIINGDRYLSEGDLDKQMNRNRGRDYDADLEDSDSAVSVDSTGKRKSFRRLIKRFAEKTSMQGVPYINNAKLLVAKIIWSVLLVIAIVALGFHLWFLFTQFYGWPVKTNVQLGFSNLRFPDVTICNTNPIHRGRFEEATGIKQLKQLVNDLNPRNLVPDQFDANYDPLADNQKPVPTNPNSPTGLPSNPSQGNTDPATTGTNHSPGATPTTGIPEQNTRSQSSSTHPQQSTISRNSRSTRTTSNHQSSTTSNQYSSTRSQNTNDTPNTQRSKSTKPPRNTEQSQSTTNPQNTQQSQGTANLKNIQQSQGTTNPPNSQQSQGTTKLSNTQKSQGTTNPTNTQTSKGTNNSTITRKSQATSKPTNTQQSRGTTNQPNTQQSKGTTKPPNTQQSQSTTNPQNTLEPSGTSKPSNTQQSQGTTKPPYTQESPGKTNTPNTQQPQATTESPNIQGSKGTANPTNTQQSNGTTKPLNTQQAKGTTEPRNTQQSQGTTNPSDTQDSPRTTNPTTTQQPQATTNLLNTQKSQGTTNGPNTQQSQASTNGPNTEQKQSTTNPPNTKQSQGTTYPPNARTSSPPNTHQSQGASNAQNTQQTQGKTNSQFTQQSRRTTVSRTTQQSQGTIEPTNTQQSQRITDSPTTHSSQRTTNSPNTRQSQGTTNPPNTQGTIILQNSQSTRSSNNQQSNKMLPNKTPISSSQQSTARPQSSRQDSGVGQSAQTASTTTTSITESQTTTQSQTESGTKGPRPPTPPPVSGPPPQIRKKRFVSDLDGLNLTSYDDNYVDTLTNKELTDSEFNGQVSKTAEIRELYEELYMDIVKNQRGEIGHQIKDMLLDCTFNGRDCDDRLFRLHQTAEYGNCWILTSDKFTVTNSGPSGGLSLVLYLEVQEYLKGLTTGYGLRIQIHEPDTVPYPAEEGLFIPSSMETDIGLKMTLIDRIAGNYGDCSDGVSFNKVYSRKYTRRACHRQCEMMTVVMECDCFSDEHEGLARTYNDSLRPCRSTKEKSCESRVLRQFDTKTSSCPCPNPCKEIQYTRSISSRQWPNDDYARVLLQSICDENKEVCAELRTNINDQRIINNNFVKLNIYYEDLNFQNITEEPEIATAQFLSDVGGAVGLWIGLSILSMCEIIQLVVELVDYAVHRTIKRRRREQRRASRKLQEGRGNNDKNSKDSDKHSKDSGDKHSKYSGDKKHSKANGDLHWPHTSFGVAPKNSPRSSPRYLDIDRRPIGRISPLSDRRNNHLKDMRGYDSDSSRPSSGGKRSHGNDIGRGMRYDDDYFKRNYMMGY